MNKFLLILTICNLFFTNICYSSKIRVYNKPNMITGPAFDYTSTPLPIATKSFASMSELNEKIFEHDGIKYIKGESLGKFMLTGYCACKKCTYGTGITYSGKPVREKHTVAADLNVLPLGTFIILEGVDGRNVENYNGVYQVEDKGGGVKNKHIDIYLPTHEAASQVTYHGRAYANVYLATPLTNLYIE